MSLEESVTAGIVGGAVKAIAQSLSGNRSKSRAQQLRDRLDVLEAERHVLTIEVRNAVLREMKNLLPEAIRQAKPQNMGKRRGIRPGSPALLRLITRTVFRNTQLEPRRK